MSGVVKGVKKVFKSVVNVVKKIWKPLLIAAAVYFTAGLALAAFAPTAAFAASMPGFAGGGLLGTGIATSSAAATAGTGIFSQAAAAMGLGSLGASGGLAGGALAAGTSAASLAEAGFSAAAIAAGQTGTAVGAAGGIGAAGGAAIGTGGGTGQIAVGSTIVPGTGPTTATPAVTIGGGTTGSGAAGGAAAATAKAGMSLGEKILLASTGVNALGTLMGPDPEESRRWAGAYYGVTYKGGGEGPVTVPGPTPAGSAPASGQKLSQEPTLAKASQPLESPTLFEQKAQGDQKQDKGNDLFRPNPKVQYVRQV